MILKFYKIAESLTRAQHVFMAQDPLLLRTLILDRTTETPYTKGKNGLQHFCTFTTF